MHAVPGACGKPGAARRTLARIGRQAVATGRPGAGQLGAARRRSTTASSLRIRPRPLATCSGTRLGKMRRKTDRAAASAVRSRPRQGATAPPSAEIVRTDAGRSSPSAENSRHRGSRSASNRPAAAGAGPQSATQQWRRPRLPARKEPTGDACLQKFMLAISTGERWPSTRTIPVSVT